MWRDPNPTDTTTEPDPGFAEGAARYLANHGFDQASIRRALETELDLDHHEAEKFARMAA